MADKTINKTAEQINNVLDGNFSEKITQPVCTGLGVGVIYKGLDRFVHDFKGEGAEGENVFLGRNSGNFTMGIGGGISSQSSFNTGIGTMALQALTTGWSNVANGYRALADTTTGKYNTAIGVHALDKTTTADRNTAMGHYAAYLNETGMENTVVGASALRGNVNGHYNCFFGVESGYIAGDVSYNSAFGYKSLYKTQGGYNCAFGMNSLWGNTTGQENVAIGFAAGQMNSTGNANTYIGTNSGAQNLVGENNVFIGFSAGYHETGSQKLFIDNQGRAHEADARVKAMVYGVFNTAVASQFINFNVNKVTVNSGTTNQSSFINGLGFGVSRTSDGAEAIYFRKTTDLGESGTANIHGLDGIQFRTQGPESVKMAILPTGDLNTLNGRYKYDAVSVSADTVGDWRTYSDVNGFYTQICTVANAIKGSGTWVTKNTIASA